MKTNGYGDPFFMTPAQLEIELLRCEYCEEKPCKDACPADCSPADFIMAARIGGRQDWRRAAGEVMRNNPLGGICGMVCPDRHCMAACSHKKLDGSINIPLVQASVVEMGKRSGGIPRFAVPKSNGKKVAVVGGGPAGLAAAAALAQWGYKVDVLEARDRIGGMCNLIPDHRLSRDVLKTDLKFLLSTGAITVKTRKTVQEPRKLLRRGYKAVCVAAGLWSPIRLGVPGEEASIRMVDYLANPGRYRLKGRVAVIGGGATAVDCATVARRNGAAAVELFALETLAELPLERKERQELLGFGVEVSGRIKVTEILRKGKAVVGLKTRKVRLAGKRFSLKDIHDLPGSDAVRSDIQAVIVSIGMRRGLDIAKARGVFYAGDMTNGPTTVVEAAAAGKNAALEIDSFLGGKAKASVKKAPKPVKSHLTLPGFSPKPVSLEADFFGRPIRSPFLLSAAPPSDGLDQMRKAYRAGWAGGVMKTAFDGIPIHIPGAYMHAFAGTTYGNCDNVSGHAIDRVRREIERLVREFPDRLTIASTGGPVTGDDENDRAGWQSNTRKLESCGVMGIEYSLSCPQGGDGTEGDIVSQNAALTSKIIDWILEAGDGNVPKLFKLTAAVTSIIPIVRAIKEVLDRHPGKKAGITLANTFPTLCFRPMEKKEWEEGIVVGMSGEGVTPISYLTLATAVPVGVEISGNGGPMHYKAAADFLAIGVKTVQFCTIVMKHGYGVIDDLESGVSFLMQERGIASMRELIGRAQPNVVRGFMELSPVKKISSHDHDLCVSCGNCARCPYLAIELDAEGMPHTDPAKCIGCSICAQKCFSGAIVMRDRTKRELAVLKED